MARLSKTSAKTSKTKARKARQPKGRKTSRNKRLSAPKATPRKRLSVADFQQQADRYLNELKAARQQQVATADILKMIASSPENAQPVFDAIAESAKRLSGAQSAIVTRVIGDMLHLASFTARSETGDAVLQKSFPVPVSSSSIHSRAVQAGKVVSWTDVENNPKVPQWAKELAHARGHRSLLAVPLLSEGVSIGSIEVVRGETSPFEDNVISVLKTFADQAVIAIQNARLFNETREALERQTATSDVLKVISRSVFDLDSVLNTLIQTGIKLCEAEQGVIWLRRGEHLHLSTSGGYPQDWVDHSKRNPITPDTESYTVSGRVAATGEYIMVDDIHKDERFGANPYHQMGQYRAVLMVPLLRDGNVEGTIGFTRAKPGPFTQRQIELVQTFADQAVIAIENARLFEEVQERTRELSQSLDDLRNAQDRLVQTEKLASLGQLTAGIAHEIKNPLNFVNNFSSLSVGLIDELGETLAPAPLDQKMRGEVGELTQMLKSNLEKVVQHGKRADSIVKNMLLHSREGSGEHRSVGINALVEESLNLAYHGARAEKPGFNITLKRDLDPDAGEIELYPQEITRALLNLISNGFYAATKRKSASGDGTFEPTLSAATKNLGNTVEIRIRDNGTGIPPEVKEKMFNPFFTTKPAGEGTGLGLSMSHDIVVKQHGGSIDVETEPGIFTEFIITLPRNVAAQAPAGDKH